MRRSPLHRKTPLRARKALVRTRLKRAGTIPRRARPDEPLATWCEAAIPAVCTDRAEHRHHILRRAQGGTDGAENTFDLCRACHDYVHRNVAWAYDNGLLVRRST
jgi:hypothetical protein